MLEESKNIINFNWNESNISFEISGNGTMINATEMAKPFNKTPKDWLRTDSAKRFIKSVESVRQICPSQLIISRKGNTSMYV